MVMPNDIDLLTPPERLAKLRKRIPNYPFANSSSCLKDHVMCHRCFHMTRVTNPFFDVVVCEMCSMVLMCEAIGDSKYRLPEGCSFRRSEDRSLINPLCFSYGTLPKKKKLWYCLT